MCLPMAPTKLNGTDPLDIHRGCKLRKQLEAVVQSIQWTYAILWQPSHQQGVLEWSDGYYNGDIKTRKTIQPMELSAEELCVQRTEQLRELYESLSAGESNQPARRPCAALSPEDLTDTEWFYLVCMSFNFAPGFGYSFFLFVCFFRFYLFYLGCCCDVFRSLSGCYIVGHIRKLHVRGYHCDSNINII